MIFGKSRLLDAIKRLVARSEGGVYKRIDENRELVEYLCTSAPEFVKAHPWIFSWLVAQDVFLCNLAEMCPPTERPSFPLRNALHHARGRAYPRPWPTQLVTETTVEVENTVPSEEWIDLSDRLQQITIRLQGRGDSDFDDVLLQVAHIVERLKAGESNGASDDNGFGYTFTADTAAGGPSFFGEPVHRR